LLAGGVLGALLSQGLPAAVSARQRPDRDADGLFDDDETGVYGTNPDVFDTDGDGVGDGEEVFLGTEPLTSPPGGSAPVLCAQQGQSCAAAECCVGFCDQDELCGCVGDGGECAFIGTGGCCNGQPCNANGFCGACGLFGAPCNADAECCSGGQYGAALCCFDGVSQTTRCTDVTNIGFVCPAVDTITGSDALIPAEPNPAQDIFGCAGVCAANCSFCFSLADGGTACGSSAVCNPEAPTCTSAADCAGTGYPFCVTSLTLLDGTMTVGDVCHQPVGIGTCNQIFDCF
jgi:hypothetical protein